MKSHYIGPVAVLFFVLALTVAVVAGLGSQRAQSSVDLSGTWNVSGNTNTGIDFTCQMHLVHAPLTITPTPTGTPLPGTPAPTVIAEDLSGDMVCSDGSKASILGAVDETNLTLAFNAPGLLGCASTTARALFSADGAVISNGVFTCDPTDIASWGATRVTMVSSTPTPTPSPSGRSETFTNYTSQAVSDLHVVAASQLASVTLVSNAPGCDQPSITLSYGTVNVVWASACVDPYESVTLAFEFTGFEGLECFYWTLFGTPLGQCGTPTPSPRPPTPTPTPAPSGLIHDEAVRRIGSPHVLRLSPGAVVTKTLTVIVENQGNHPDLIGLHMAIIPPGGIDNPGGCSPARVISIRSGVPVTGRSSIQQSIDWSCSNPAAVNGQTFTIKVVADHAFDDVASCDAIPEMMDGTCEAAVADDDDDDADNSLTRSLPKVLFVP